MTVGPLALGVGWALAFLVAPKEAAGAKSERIWLVVGASDTTPAGIVRKARSLASASADGGLVFQSSDCGEKTRAFGWAAAIAGSAEAAKGDLARVQGAAKDAFVKRCDVRAGSLLAARVPAVDPSIAGVPETAVNWSDEDRVSSARPLSDGYALVVARYHVDQPSDPLEGRRERVVLIDPQKQRTVLTDDCPSATAVFATRPTPRVAVQCAREQAGEQLLHSTLVFGADGKKLTEIAHCRRPRFSRDTLRCDEESVGADGALKLREKKTALPARP